MMILAGSVVSRVLKAFFSGGGSLGAKFGVRFKSLLDKLPMDARARDRLDAMLGEDRDGDGRTDDRDDDSACSVYGGSCGCNSFPAGTLVLLASGAYRPIEMIDPGERVVTYDTASAVWRDQPVLAQWSGIHDGAMATIHLDGGSLTSTDGHEFWVNDRGEWVEAGQLQPGDLLLGPDGVTRVESVALTDGAGSVVWELDTAVNNNYVIGQPQTLLAHNADDDGCSPAGLFGHEFEEWLVRKLSGEGPFKAGGREFDGRVGDVWYEAKSGPYWKNMLGREGGLQKFKSDMGSRKSIASGSGATYELHSNVPIPEEVKHWLTEYGIPFTEHLES